MGLFKIPTRIEQDIHSVLKKAQQEYKPKIKVKGNTLLDTLSAIAEKVNQNLGSEKDNYLCITSDEEFIKYCEQAVRDGTIAIDTETTGLSYKDQSHLVGLCIQSLNQKPAYVPYNHISVVTEHRVEAQVSKEALIEGIKIIYNSKSKLIWHNAYYDLVVIYLFSSIWLWVDWDTMIAGWLLNENESHSLKNLYAKYIIENNTEVHKFGDLFDDVPFCYVPYNVGYIYGAHDAEMTLSLYLFQKPYLTKGTYECKECDLEKSADILSKMELPLIVHLCKMRVNGIRIDYVKADELKEKYEGLKNKAEKNYNESIEQIKDKIEEYNSCHSAQLPYPPNFNSPSQMAILFYDILNIGVIDKKSPRGTGADIIDTIANLPRFEKQVVSKIAKALLDVKTFDKLLGSFINKLPSTAHEYEGKIHCNFNQLGTSTGRFSSSSPNLQQIPSKYKDIRQMFIPKEGNVFINCDYSQQEMMAVAALAQDKLMLESFEKGRDIYSHIASIAFNVPYEDCLEFEDDGITVKIEGKARRKKAKAIALGIVYGKGVSAIADDLHVEVEKAQEIKDSILGAFPELKEYLDRVVEYCKETGYVKTFYGRKRRLPDIHLEEYTFEFFGEVDKKTQKYYKGLYLGKLKRCRKLSEKFSIINQALSKGIKIHQNNGFIAKAIRESYNCVDKETEILTINGWKNYDEITIGDRVLSYNMQTNNIEFDSIQNINIYEDNHIDVVEFSHPNFSAVSTHNHRWVIYNKATKKIGIKTTDALSRHGDDRILRVANNNFREAPYSDDFLKLCGWIVTDSTYKKNKQKKISSIIISQAKPEMVEHIQSILDRLGIDAYISSRSNSGNYDLTTWDLHKANSEQFFELFPNRRLTYDFIFSLSQRQANIILQEILLADGGGEGRKIVASTKEIADLYQSLALVAGKASSINVRNSIGRKCYSENISNPDGYIETKKLYYVVGILERDRIQLYHKHCIDTITDLVWCPTTTNGTWVARRNGIVYISGNSPVQGTAADITKKAMLNIATNQRLKELGAEMVLTIHDESCTSVPREYAYEASKIIEQCSIDAGEGLGAPLRCDIAISDRWEGQQYTFDRDHNLIPLENGG